MKKCINIILFIIMLSSLISCDYISMIRIYNKLYVGISKTDSIYREDTQSSFIPTDFNETSRLFYLCKVWGFTKYYHENITPITPKVDSILIANISKAINCENKSQYVRYLSEIINEIQISDFSGTNPFQDISDYALIDNDWMNDTICLTNKLSIKLLNLFKFHTGRANRFTQNKKGTGAVKQFNENEYTSFEQEEVRLLGLFRYWNLINYFYPSKNYIDENWDQVLYESIPYFRKAVTETEYRLAIYRLTNKLKDSHTSQQVLIDRKVIGAYRPNFRVQKISKSYIINEIRLPEENKEGFKLGDRLLYVNGKDINHLFDSLKIFVSGGNEWSNKSFVNPAIIASHDSISIFTLIRREDTLCIESKNQTAYNLLQKEIKKDENMHKEVLYKWINDTIAYWDLKHVTPKNFKRNYENIKTAKVIILDLRCYPHSHIIGNIADTFVPPETFFSCATYADTNFPGMLRILPTGKLGSKKYFSGRIFVLVNEYTQSFSEYLAMLLQANPYAITVGSPTSGADGNVSRFDFPGGVITYYTGLGIYYPDMQRTQRIGVHIDHIVYPTYESILNERDIIFEKALQLAKTEYNEKNRKHIR